MAADQPSRFTVSLQLIKESKAAEVKKGLFEDSSGFEADRDLVAAVEGHPQEKYAGLLGKKVRGGTSFRFGLLFDEIPKTLDVIAERFDSRAHLKQWPQMTYLRQVPDPVRVAELEA